MTKNTPNTPRAVWIDSARVLATILIVIFHLPSSDFKLNGLSRDIWTLSLTFFCNPSGVLCFFFVLAGYFTSRNMSWPKWRSKWLMLFSAFLLWNAIFSLGLSDGSSMSRIYGIGSGYVVCADYPLWFVLDLLLMLIFFPLIRKFPLIAMLSCALLIIIHKLKPIAFFIEYPVFPHMDNWLFFTLGFFLNRFSIDTIREKMLKLAVPLSVLTVALSVWSFYQKDILSFPFNSTILPLCYAGFIASIGLSVEVWAPQKLLRVVASVAPSTFFCYAIHAGIIIGVSRLLSRLAPALNSNAWLPLCVALLIIPISYLGYNLIKAYCPVLLPLLCNERWKKKS